MLKQVSLFFLMLLWVIQPGCTRSKMDADAGKLLEVSVQLDWFPEPQHGGLYQAIAKGYFKDEGLKVSLKAGGNNALVHQIVGANRAKFGQIASSTVILSVARGLPVKIISTVFHNAPSVLMLHADNPVDRFEDLDGKRIMGRPEALYVPYLKRKYRMDFNLIPQSFGLGQFIHDKDFIQEGFYIAEFYLIEKAGVKPKALYLWDSGYLNALTLIVNTDFFEENPGIVKGFVRAYRKGWREYLEGDPAPANALIKKDNQEIAREVDDAFLSFSRELIIRDNLARGNAEWGEDYASVSRIRFVKQIEQLEELGVIEKGHVRGGDILAREFVSK